MEASADSSTDTAFLRVVDLSKSFGDFLALKDISLSVDEGELICFLGPSGCGKTTLLRAIAGLDFQSSGRIYQAGEDISTLAPTERDFGIVFQSYALFPNMTVAKNVGYGLNSRKLARSATNARVAELLELVGLPDSGPKYPSALSGGQQQRVALARALATSPGLLLLDEPLSALDAKVRIRLRHEIKDLQRRLGITTILVTHDQEEALAMADRIVVMNHGVIEQVGSPTDIYREPQTLFVADFIGAMNQLPGKAVSATSVQLGDMVLDCVPHAMADGADGVVSIRPEDVVPHGVGARSPGAPDVVANSKNAFDVTVSEVEFLGSYWRVVLTGEKLGGAELIADFSINAVKRMSVVEGTPLTVELPSDRLKFFPPNPDIA